MSGETRYFVYTKWESEAAPQPLTVREAHRVPDDGAVEPPGGEEHDVAGDDRIRVRRVPPPGLRGGHVQRDELLRAVVLLQRHQQQVSGVDEEGDRAAVVRPPLPDRFLVGGGVGGDQARIGASE